MQQENTTVTAASYAITSKDPSDVSAGAQDISGMALIVQVNIPGFLKTGLVKISTHSTTWQFKTPKLIQRPIKSLYLTPSSKLVVPGVKI